MRIIMRIFFLMCILGASLTIAAQNIIYGNKNEQRAINMAFDILQVYYHSKELCVSDSIYDLDWDIFSDMVDTQTKQILWSYRIEKKFIWNAPTYSEALLSLIPQHYCKLNFLLLRYLKSLIYNSVAELRYTTTKSRRAPKRWILWCATKTRPWS